MKKFVVDLLNLYHCPMHFGAFVMRMAFGFLFLTIALQELRHGYGTFAQTLMTGDYQIVKDMPAALVMTYGYMLPAAELMAGVLLICNQLPKVAYSIAALI